MSNQKRPAAAFLAVVLGTALTGAAPASTAVNSISRYCTACWRNARLPADVWPDCTQEVFVRLLERVPADAWNDTLNDSADEHRELVRAIDCVKKRVQRTKKTQTYPVNGVVDGRMNSDADRRAEHEEWTRAADEVLTPRQKSVLQMWAMGYEVTDIAHQLGTTPARVSDEKYKAVRKLRDYLESTAVEG